MSLFSFKSEIVVSNTKDSWDSYDPSFPSLDISDILKISNSIFYILYKKYNFKIFTLIYVKIFN